MNHIIGAMDITTAMIRDANPASVYGQGDLCKSLCFNTF